MAKWDAHRTTVRAALHVLQTIPEDADVSIREVQGRIIDELLLQHPLRTHTGVLHTQQTFGVKLQDLAVECGVKSGALTTQIERFFELRLSAVPSRVFTKYDFDPATFSAENDLPASLPSDTSDTTHALKSGRTSFVKRQSKARTHAHRNRSCLIVAQEVQTIRDMRLEADYVLKDDAGRDLFLEALISRYSLSRLNENGVVIPMSVADLNKTLKHGATQLKPKSIRNFQEIVEALESEEGLPQHNKNTAKWSTSDVRASPSWPQSTSTTAPLSPAAPTPSPITPAQIYGPETQSDTIEISTAGSLKRNHPTESESPISNGSSSARATEEGRVENEASQPGPDSNYVNALKRAKLAIPIHDQDKSAGQEVGPSTYPFAVTEAAVWTVVEDPTHSGTIDLTSTNVDPFPSADVMPAYSDTSSRTDGTEAHPLSTNEAANLPPISRQFDQRVSAGTLLFAEAPQIANIKSPVAILFTEEQELVQTLLRHLGIKDINAICPLERGPGTELEALYKLIWGQEWPKHCVRLSMREEDPDSHLALTCYNALMSLLDAYLFKHVLKKPLPWHLPSVDAGSYRERCQEYLGCHPETLSKQLIMNITSQPSFRNKELRSHVDALTSHMINVLELQLENLVDVQLRARLDMGWRLTFRRSLSDLVEKAVLLKIDMSTSLHDYFAFWPSSGQSTNRKTMEILGGCDESQKVAYTLTAGLTAKVRIGDRVNESACSKARVFIQP